MSVSRLTLINVIHKLVSVYRVFLKNLLTFYNMISNTQCKVDFYPCVFSNTLYVVVFISFFLSFYRVVVNASWPYLLGSHSLYKHCLDVNGVSLYARN